MGETYIVDWFSGCRFYWRLALQANALINGDFQTGDFTGWTANSAAVVCVVGAAFLRCCAVREGISPSNLRRRRCYFPARAPVIDQDFP